LTPGQEYCAEVVAENGSGAEYGGQRFFVAGAPKVLTFEASPTGTTSATVEGEINPAGEETHYQVAYGAASSLWCRYGYLGSPEYTTALQPLGFTDLAFHAVTMGLSGLSPGMEYCAELIGVDHSGSDHGASVTFTTVSEDFLGVSLAGTGSGTVSGSGISCPATCSQIYATGTHVSLSAVSAAGSTFTGWSGACTGTGACAVTLTALERVTATFTADPAPPAVGVVSVVGSTVAVKSTGATAVKLTCSGNTTCVGKLTLTAKVTAKKGKRKHAKTETIGTASFSIAPGATAMVSVKLSRSGPAQLSAAHGHLNATLVILRTSPGPTITTSRTIHLILQRTKNGKG
jgi:hypothetical protein